jgi:hypothetical protein
MVIRKNRKYKQRFTKTLHIKLEMEKHEPYRKRVCSGRIIISCSTSATRDIVIDTNPVISHEWGKDEKCVRHARYIRGHLWHSYSVAINQAMVATVKLSKWQNQLNQ